jgi:chromosomal replication initiation ATPase DnaA
LEKKFAGDEWNKWLIHLDIDSLDENKIIFCVEEKFYRDWINKCFMNENQLLNAVKEVEQGIDNLKIIHKNKVE